jgi:hypothetical protein
MRETRRAMMRYTYISNKHLEPFGTFGSNRLARRVFVVATIAAPLTMITKAQIKGIFACELRYCVSNIIGARCEHYTSSTSGAACRGSRVCVCALYSHDSHSGPFMFHSRFTSIFNSNSRAQKGHLITIFVHSGLWRAASIIRAWAKLASCAVAASAQSSISV